MRITYNSKYPVSAILQSLHWTPAQYIVLMYVAVAYEYPPHLWLLHVAVTLPPHYSAPCYWLNWLKNAVLIIRCSCDPRSSISMAAMRLSLDRFLVGAKGSASPSASSIGPLALARRGCDSPLAYSHARVGLGCRRPSAGGAEEAGGFSWLLRTGSYDHVCFLGWRRRGFGWGGGGEGGKFT